ncbi:hypothetical protein GOP47_0005927 [Adiantum capillus-veneris]|uniref:Phototropic-responsive NPH3 family protein n=1 Tax=Adiantum capillus-veneris TaxID=13818 RepID=A0A9D4V1X2_ADICA|nr:hypothetical protein GOP47_0005927 [Adiantum capillus-veneris]
MACLKVGFKPDGFQRKGQEWFCSSGLPSDVVIDVEQMSFHLHKFPLVSRSRKLARLMEECLEDELLHVHLREIPGGPDAFELAAKFCYSVRLELTAANVVPLRCAAEYLEMTEEFGEANLIAVTEGFLSQIVLRNWKECIRALQSCETVFPASEKLGIISRCVVALTLKACTNPSLQGLPMPNSVMQSPGGSLLWNGISTGARPKRTRSDWWYEDISMLSLPLYKRVIEAMKHRGIKPENVAGALMHLARRYLPALNKRQSTKDGSGRFGSLSLSVASSEDEQRVILETIERLLPVQKAVVPSRFLSGLLRSAFILNASPDCRNRIERRIGLQLEQVNLEDLLLPNLTYNLETLYDIDCVQRILDHFLLLDQSTGGTLSSPNSDDDGQAASSPSLTPMAMVARLMDSYLGEVAPDVNLKPSKFQSLAEALPDFARVSDDALYRAIDIYLKAHPWLKEGEKEQLSHPLQHQSASETMPPAAASMRGEGWANAIRNNQALKVDMDHMNLRVNNLERECSGMREELEKIVEEQHSLMPSPITTGVRDVGGELVTRIPKVSFVQLICPTSVSRRTASRLVGDVGSLPQHTDELVVYYVTLVKVKGFAVFRRHLLQSQRLGSIVSV